MSPGEASPHDLHREGGVGGAPTTQQSALPQPPQDPGRRAASDADLPLSAAQEAAALILAKAQQRADELVQAAYRQGERELAAARADVAALLERVEDSRPPAPAPAPAATDPSATRMAPSPAAPAPTRERRGRWGRAMYRLRWPVLAVATALLTASAWWGPAVVGLLSSGGFDVPGSQSYRTEHRIIDTVGRPDIDAIAMYSSTKYTTDDPEFKDAVANVVAAVPRDGVRSVSSYWTTQFAPFVSRDKHSTYIAVRLAGDADQRLSTWQRIESKLTIDPAVADTAFGSTAPVDAQINDQVASDLARAEMLSAPLLGLLLIIVFGGLVAAGMPLLIGGLTTVVSFVVLRLLLHVTDVSVFAVNIVTILGLGLSVDYALLVVSRFREEVRAGRATDEALARTMATAGRSVAISSVIVCVSMAGLFFFPEVFLRSMAFGGVSAVAVAALSSLTVLPAVLGVLGHRVDAWRLRWPAALRRRFGRGSSGRGRHSRAANLWERLAHTVMRRAWLSVAAVCALLAVMVVPVVSATFGGVDSRQLPPNSDGRRVDVMLAQDFPRVQNDPIKVLVEGADEAGVQSLVARINAVPDASAARVVSRAGGASLITVDYPGNAVDAQARAVVEGIRELAPPAGATIGVAGFSAEQVDLRASIRDGLWKLALLQSLATAVMLFWAFGSLLIPVKAVLITYLTIAASFGAVVWIFQEGHLSGLLDFTSTGSVELTQLILIVAILFGVTTDYEVFLLSRIREQWDAGHDNANAVATGLQRTGPIITSAAVLILVVIAAFSTSKILFIKLIGVGMAISILLDATIMRAILVPATMKLLGHWNWWAPGPLLRLWERHRPTSEEWHDDEPGGGDRAGSATEPPTAAPGPAPSPTQLSR